MAKLQVYKFINPGNSGKENPATSAARTQTLALNRIGNTTSSIATIVSDIEKISIASIKDDKKREQFERRRERRQKDQAAEDNQEMVKAGKDKGLQKKIAKKVKGTGLFGFLEDFLGPIGSLFMKLGAFALTSELLKYLGDKKNTEKISTFFTKAKFVFDKLKEFGENIANAIGDGLDFIFGKETTFEERLKAFGTIAAAIGGIGGILAAAQGARDLLGLGETADDLTPDRRPKGDGPDGKPRKPTTTPDGKPKKPLSAFELEQQRKKATQELIEEMGGTTPTKPKPIPDSKPKWWQRLKQGAGDLIEGGKKNFMAGLNALGDVAKGTWNATMAAKDAVGRTASQWADNVGQFTVKQYENLKAGAKSFFQEKIKGLIDPVIRPVKDAALGAGKQIMSFLQGLPGFKQVLEFLKRKGIGGIGDIAQAGSKLGKRAASILPVIGGVVNLAFAYDRFASGDSIGGLLESISGILDFTGDGVPLSMALDGYMFARDFIPALQEGENKMINDLGLGALKGQLDSTLSQLPNLGELVGMFMGKAGEIEGVSPTSVADQSGGLGVRDTISQEAIDMVDLYSNGGPVQLQEMFLGGVVKGIGKAVGGIGKTVGKIASNPLVQTAASFIPGAAPIMAGINMATGLMSGNPMNMLGAAAGMIPGLGGMMNSGLGQIGSSLLGGDFMGAAMQGLGMIPGLSGMMSGALGNIAGNVLGGNFMGAAATGLGMVNPGLGQLAGSVLGSGLNPLSMVGGLAEQFGMGGVMSSMLSGDPMSAAGDIAKELGVDPKIVGGVQSTGSKILKEGGLSAEYAMQTAMEFVPIPVILDKIVPMQVAVPINTGGGGVVTATPSSLTQRQ